MGLKKEVHGSFTRVPNVDSAHSSQVVASATVRRRTAVHKNTN